MSSTRSQLTVGQVAKLAHVSVRTLHHYDAVGLLVPSGRTAAGYRLYTQRDLERLQQILFYRALGFGLERICRLVAEQPAERRAALVQQRAMLARQSERCARMVELIDATLGELDGDTMMNGMTRNDMFEVFGDFDPSEHEQEVAERWGSTDAYAESQRRARRYTKEDWQRFRSENDAINAAIAELIDANVPADDARALDAVERARLLIDTWFYPCSRALHASLGRMCVEDPRFRATYDSIRPGMAGFVQAATAANAARG